MTELRDKIVREIASAYCHECNAGEPHAEIADRILGLLEIYEGLRARETMDKLEALLAEEDR